MKEDQKPLVTDLLSGKSGTPLKTFIWLSDKSVEWAKQTEPIAYQKAALTSNYLYFRSVGESAIYDACSKFNTSQLQSQRASFQDLVRSTLGRRFNTLWADVTDLQVNSVTLISKVFS